MKLSEFTIGLEFWISGARWRCTDVGSRVGVAISLEPHEVMGIEFDHRSQTKTVTPPVMTNDSSWFKGPPYAVVEHVFDEEDLTGCTVNEASA